MSDGVTWGLGAQFPTRSPLRALVEWQGEFVIERQHPGRSIRRTSPRTAASRRSSARSPIRRTSSSARCGKAPAGFFVHGGLNYSFGTAGRTVGGLDIDHNAWGFDVRLGWHPGVTPARQRVRVVKETTTITNTRATAAARRHRRRRRRTATRRSAPQRRAIRASWSRAGRRSARRTATDPDGDPVTYRWTAPAGTFSAPNAPNTTWTAPQPAGQRAADRDGDRQRAAARRRRPCTCRWSRREVLVFEDVHFDFDRFNLRPDALKILDDAVAKLQANPTCSVTIEGHYRQHRHAASTTWRSASAARTACATTSCSAGSRTCGCGR